MRKFLKKLAVVVTATTIAAAPLAAQETTTEEPLRFSGYPDVSTRNGTGVSSLPYWFPAFVAVSLASRIDSKTRVLGAGGFEKVLTGDGVDNLRVELGWPLGFGSAASSAASSATSSSPFGDLTPYFVVGAVVASYGIDYFVNPGGGVFATNGTEDFRGLYAGLNVDILGHRGRRASAASSAALLWSAFFNVGWGWSDIDAFGGGFRRSDDGLFWEVGTSVQLEMGGVFFGPSLVYRRADGSIIKIEDLVLGLTLTVPFNRQE